MSPNMKWITIKLDSETQHYTCISNKCINGEKAHWGVQEWEITKLVDKEGSVDRKRETIEDIHIG